MSKKRIMNIRPQEVTENGERSVRYKGSDGKMHDIAAGNGEPDGGSTAQDTLIVGQGAIVTSDEVIAALRENRPVLYIIDDAKYTHYSRSISTYEGDDGLVVHVLTPGGTFQHNGTRIVIW